ncbi:MAG TPA: cation transporter [Gemmatimonadaceae bacterium]|jgi:cation diffusion facilitator family transporter
MIGHTFRFPHDQLAQRRKARRLAWLSICLLLSAATLMYFVMGQSQAMKTAWVSDVLTAVPPAALLAAMRYELRPASKRFPFGYLRSISISFLVTASVLSVIGLYLLYDSLSKLMKQERPAIGTIELFGHQLWLGWAMIAVLVYSMLIGVLLGVLKKPVAKHLFDKELEAEAKMNRAEWMSEAAAIIGILLVAFGHWWGDAAAAAFISLEVVMDGWESIQQVVRDLMDESPTVIGGDELEDLPAKVKHAAERLPWVERAAVRLREHGHAITGDVFVVPHADPAMSADTLVAHVESGADELCQLDWRLHDLTVMPVQHLESIVPPRVGVSAPRPSR